MQSVKKWAKRGAMTLLFLLALLTTFHSISGVGPTTLLTYLSQNNNNEPNSLGAMAIKMIQRINLAPLKVDAATTSKPQTLEELDWSGYPKKVIEATGYTAGVESTGKNPDHPEYGITYSGVKVKRDLFSTVAADLTIFPIGTVLYIPGYGYGVVADKGGAITGNKIDLYYDTVDEVYEQWGKKMVEVSIIKMGNGTLTEEELRAMNEDQSMQVFRQQYVGEKSS